ncbi:MAG: hypothetical protein K2I70_02625 [Bacilli bacterium]|nr:hypothetical protein [Bacilli bacterium]
MKNRIRNLIIEILCTAIIYALLMFVANKIGLIEGTDNIIFTSIGFVIGLLSVKVSTLIRSKKKEGK